MLDLKKISTEGLLVIQDQTQATLAQIGAEIEARMATAQKAYGNGKAGSLPEAFILPGKKRRGGPRKKRSAATRKKMSEGQKIRWSKVKEEKK